MSLSIEVARLGRPLELVLNEADGSDLAALPRLVVGLGRGAQASLPQALPSFWLCLRGAVAASTGHGAWQLQSGQLLVHTEPRLRLASIGDAEWLGLACTPAELQRLLGGAPAVHGSLEAAPPALLAAARCALEEAAAGELQPETAASLVGGLAALDSETQSRIDRCPGRSGTTRSLSYQRLLRARSRILTDPASVESIEALAALASYSTWHFIRVFHQVFGETPMECAQRLRLERARYQVEVSRLAVSQIARDAGFETFSAFCRSFRAHYGETATRWRELHQGGRDADAA